MVGAVSRAAPSVPGDGSAQEPTPPEPKGKAPPSVMSMPTMPTWGAPSVPGKAPPASLPLPPQVPGTAFAKAVDTATGSAGTTAPPEVKPVTQKAVKPPPPTPKTVATPDASEYNQNVPDELATLPKHSKHFGTPKGPDGAPKGLSLLKAEEHQLRMERAAVERYRRRIIQEASAAAKAASVAASDPHVTTSHQAQLDAAPQTPLGTR